MEAKQGSIGAFEKKLNFDTISFKANLEAKSEIMEVSEFSVQSSTVNFRGNGSLSKLKALTDGNTSTAPLFNFDLADVILEKFF